MKYGSVCSGIEAATVAWHPLGWEPAWFSEIEKFPAEVLKHHYPNVPNLGDMTKINERKEFNDQSINLLVGGTPCQSFSVAGLRKGMDDERGNLAIVFLKILDAKRPQWVVWENVPGVLSSNKGKDFGSFLGGLAELGYGWAYRTLDAQYFGVPQRRRRVFVVGYLGDWRPATAVLFERASLSGNSAPSRSTGKRASGNAEKSIDGSWPAEVAATLRNDNGTPGFSNQDIFSQNCANFVPEVSPAIKARDYKGQSSDGYGDGQPLIPIQSVGRNGNQNGSGIGKDGDKMFTLSTVEQHAVAFQTAEMRLTGKITLKDQVPMLKSETKKGDTEPLILYENHANDSRITEVDQSPTISSRAGTGGNNLPLVGSFKSNPGAKVKSFAYDEHITPTLDTSAGKLCSHINMSVRRLTPRECERLQGFPDDYTLIPVGKKMAADSPRYKALGNSMAVPVMNWIGKRITEVELAINGTRKNL